ncbi:DUF3592 domain-containing protein [Neptunomonas phycophila]|jgi:hypothetical protein|uniref:DUF3592 domain-containing protein n=1 Tax=Neptunomonas phycophila TaxID=1572645 RepID=UPI0023F6B9E9|nr:DUF3592 domain-containing protein [Neptunomonas phycophila]
MEFIHYCSEMWQLAIAGEPQGIFFWAAIYTFVVCLYSTIFQCLTRRWPSTQGQLMDAGVNTFGGRNVYRADTEYISKAVYRYTVSDNDYEGKRVSPWVIVTNHNAKGILNKQLSGIQRLPNGKVRVFYKPSNPKKSFLILPSKIGIGFTFATSVLPLILFYVKYYT